MAGPEHSETAEPVRDGCLIDAISKLVAEHGGTIQVAAAGTEFADRDCVLAGLVDAIANDGGIVTVCDRG